VCASKFERVYVYNVGGEAIVKPKEDKRRGWSCY
jgi:hypothetical protein